MNANLDALLTQILTRRASVEQELFDMAAGKKPMPDADALRALALRLGTPGTAEKAADCYLRAEPGEPRFTFIGRDALTASIIRLWVEARNAIGNETGDAQDIALAANHWALRLGKEPLDVLDYVPIKMLGDALVRRNAKKAPHDAGIVDHD